MLTTRLSAGTTRVSSTVPMRTARGGRLELHVAWDGARLVATERLPLRDVRNAALRQALDATWRELGVGQVRSGWTGLRRTVPG